MSKTQIQKQITTVALSSFAMFLLFDIANRFLAVFCYFIKYNYICHV